MTKKVKNVFSQKLSVLELGRKTERKWVIPNKIYLKINKNKVMPITQKC